MQCIPGSRLVVIPKATHLMSHQNPTDFNPQVLLHFLAQLGGGRSRRRGGYLTHPAGMRCGGTALQEESLCSSGALYRSRGERWASGAVHFLASKENRTCPCQISSTSHTMSHRLQHSRRLCRGISVRKRSYVAAKLGIADVLKDGPKRCEELAQATGTHARSLYLCSWAPREYWGVHRRAARRVWVDTSCRMSADRGSWVVMVMAIMHGEEHYRAWGNMLDSVLKTGEPAFNDIFGQGVFAYLAEHPEAAAVLNEGMTDRATEMAQAVVQAYDFSSYGTIVDVGRGTGTFLRLSCRRTRRRGGFCRPAACRRRRDQVHRGQWARWALPNGGGELLHGGAGGWRRR